MPADVLYYWQGHSCQTGRRVEARLRLIWFFAPSYWGFSTGLLTLSRKKKFCYGNLEHSWVSIQKAGRGHTAVKVLCCRPVCKWAWWAVGMTGSDVFVDLKTQSFNAPYFKNENGKPPPLPPFYLLLAKVDLCLTARQVLKCLLQETFWARTALRTICIFLASSCFCCRPFIPFVVIVLKRTQATEIST